MARRFLVPSSTCSLTATSSARVWQWVWVGLVAASDGAACAAFYAGSADTDPHLWTLSVASNAGQHGTGLVGPFATGASLILADLTGTRASALIASASR